MCINGCHASFHFKHAWIRYCHFEGTYSYTVISKCLLYCVWELEGTQTSSTPYNSQRKQMVCSFLEFHINLLHQDCYPYTLVKGSCGWGLFTFSSSRAMHILEFKEICFSFQEMDDRKHEARVARKMSQKGKSQVSNIDPRFRQQMWKLMKKRPKKTSAAAPASEK